MTTQSGDYQQRLTADDVESVLLRYGSEQLALQHPDLWDFVEGARDPMENALVMLAEAGYAVVKQDSLDSCQGYPIEVCSRADCPKCSVIDNYGDE